MGCGSSRSIVPLEAQNEKAVLHLPPSERPLVVLREVELLKSSEDVFAIASACAKASRAEEGVLRCDVLHVRDKQLP